MGYIVARDNGKKANGKIIMKKTPKEIHLSKKVAIAKAKKLKEKYGGVWRVYEQIEVF